MIVPVLPDSALFAGHAIVQVCWVVPSLEDAIERWRNLFGIGPWLVVDSAAASDKRYRGVPTDVQYRAALVQSGEIQIELIEQTSTGPSCFREVVRENTTGLHHVAIVAKDYDAELDRFGALGFSPAFDAAFGDMHFAMIDTMSSVGFMIEVFEDKPALHQSMALVRSLADGWDGVTSPVRRLEDLIEQA